MAFDGDSQDLTQVSREELESLATRQREQLDDVRQQLDQVQQAYDGKTNELERVEADLDQVKARVDELMNDQARMEEELAGRIEVLDKLRASMRDLERDKKDAAKRYREQAESFDSERQSWYDQEQHYKLRIENLSSPNKGRRKRKGRRARAATDSEAHTDVEDSRSNHGGREDPQTGSDEPDDKDEETKSPTPERSSNTSPTPSSEREIGPTPNELALQDQLASLSTAHDSLTATLRTLQTEMADLKRVYQNVQEENESYEILLGEKTLNGEVRGSDLFRRSFQWGDAGEDLDEHRAGHSFGFLGGLDTVGESNENDYELSSEGEEEDEDDATKYDAEEDDDDDPVKAKSAGGEIEDILLDSRGTGSPRAGVEATNEPSPRRGGARRASKKRPSINSDVPKSGSGLDLAAELEAAQADNGSADEVTEQTKDTKFDKRRASKATLAERRGSAPNVEELRIELKQLREANKALTLYVSKIVDRVCSQEGFEKVLAVDYRAVTPKLPMPEPVQAPPAAPAPTSTAASVIETETIKFRSASLRSASSNLPPASPSSAARVEFAPKDVTHTTPISPVTVNSGRKGLGWDSVASVFGLARSSPSPLPPGSNSAGLKAPDGARRLGVDEEQEDEEDQLERERLRAEMQKLGISGEEVGNQWGSPAHALKSPMPVPLPFTPTPPTPPTKELAQQAEAVIKTEDEHERKIKAELAEGKASGFTEPKKRRPSMRSRTSSVTSVPMGLGIVDEHNSAVSIGSSPADSERASATTSPRPSPKIEENEESEAPGWNVGRHFRRLSKTFTSPPVS